MEKSFFALGGIVGSFIASLFGGWTDALITLLIFMLVDYILGIVCATVFKKSKKTASGKLSSKAMFKGLFKKVGELVIIIVAVRLDILLGGGSYVKDGAVIVLVLDEALSIVENLGLMGVPIPKAIQKAIEVLQPIDGEADTTPNNDGNSI